MYQYSCFIHATTLSYDKKIPKGENPAFGKERRKNIIYKPAGKAGEFLGEARRPHQLLTVQPLSSF